WFFVRHSTPVIAPASWGVYSTADPSGLSGSVEMLRSCVSTNPSGCGPACAVPALGLSAASDNPASVAAENCMVSRRDIFVALIPPPPCLSQDSRCQSVNSSQHVIPGATAKRWRARNPYSPDLWLWIPGSRPAAEPRNDETRSCP